ncbi:MAG: serine/threonine protein kinase, partial [archaeon]
NIIHGDLTTSNMIYSKNEVYFIDFGLGYESSNIEDKATDLHLIKQALEAKHFKYFEKLFNSILKGYKISKNYSLVVKRLEAVEKRGRYKQSY